MVLVFTIITSAVTTTTATTNFIPDDSQTFINSVLF